jgi:hypothetical protein
MHLVQGGSDLSAAAKLWLKQHVQVRISAELDNPLSPTTPEGAVDYRLEFFLSWMPHGPDAEFPDLEAALTSTEGITWDPQDLGGEILIVDVVLGSADLVVVDVTARDLFFALDARSGTLADMYPVLFAEPDIVPRLLDELANAGCGYAILLDELTVEPPWQDADIASLCLGLGLVELGRGCVFAAIDTRAQAIAGRAAADLGFEPFERGISVLDLGLTTLEETITVRLGSSD